VTQVREDHPQLQWRDFLERLTQEHEGDEVTIEVLSPEFGDQEEAVRLPLAYLEYDNKDDVVFVVVGGPSTRYPTLRHMIFRPRKILVDPPSPEAARAVDVEDKDGIHTIVTLYRRASTPTS
jgi:hypothetical protein